MKWSFNYGLYFAVFIVSTRFDVLDFISKIRFLQRSNCSSQKLCGRVFYCENNKTNLSSHQFPYFDFLFMIQEALKMTFHFCLAWSADSLVLATNVNLVCWRPLPNYMICRKKACINSCTIILCWLSRLALKFHHDQHVILTTPTNQIPQWIVARVYSWLWWH